MTVLLIYYPTPHILFGKSSSPEMLRCCTLLPFGILNKHITHRINSSFSRGGNLPETWPGLLQIGQQQFWNMSMSSFYKVTHRSSFKTSLVTFHHWRALVLGLPTLSCFLLCASQDSSEGWVRRETHDKVPSLSNILCVLKNETALFEIFLYRGLIGA